MWFKPQILTSPQYTTPTLSGVITGGGNAFVACGPYLKSPKRLVTEILTEKYQGKIVKGQQLVSWPKLLVRTFGI